jgi:hypothetical protein
MPEIKEIGSEKMKKSEKKEVTSGSKWINNQVPLWKHIIKPCKFCGFCPYGQLVEEYPRPRISRSVAVKHNEYLKKAIVDGVFDEENKKNGRPHLTRAKANESVKQFNPEDYPDKVDPIDDNMRCSVFGHHCPVYYQGEILGEDGKPSKKEIKLFEDELKAIGSE